MGKKRGRPPKSPNPIDKSSNETQKQGLDLSELDEEDLAIDSLSPKQAKKLLKNMDLIREKLKGKNPVSTTNNDMRYPSIALVPRFESKYNNLETEQQQQKCRIRDDHTVFPLPSSPLLYPFLTTSPPMDNSSQQQQQQYDPSLMQAYDQSSQQQHYYYYDFNHQHQFQQQEPTTCVPVHSAGPSQAHQPNPVQGTPDAGSLNPAAVAVVAGALAQQLSHYTGNVDGMQTRMYEQIGPPQYRGRGRRGGRPYRRGGRGHFNNRGRAPYRGRGRGRVGDGRHLPSPSGPAISNVADAPAAEATSVVQPVPLESSHVPLLDPTQGPAASLQPQVVAKLWCEICKAECNSPEIMQQHINGKRHKKNLLVHEELQRRKDVNGQQSGQISTPQLNLTIQESETVNLKDETKQQNIVGGTSEVPAEALEGEPSGNSATLKGCRGSKYMRANDGSRKPVEPKQAVSFICELCNVKCESPVAYNSHRTGKKHMANFKRVCGHQGLNGEAGMQQLQPPDANDLSNSNNSQVQQSVGVQQGVSDPQVLLAQLLMTVQTVLSQVQVPATAPLSGPVAAQTQAVAGSSHKQQNLSQTRASGGSTAHLESENVNAETKTQLLSATSQLDNTAGPSSDTQTADG
ncbi:hypothetical protein RIF29_30000 [Crotalaria pallida]|uniref:Uncharacterized protein n=1 Tax=Crotalaria pallida TaxID=3830 RepID=A0AAN9EFI4_CROPI